MRLTKRARDGIFILTYKDDQGNRKRISTGTRDRNEAELQATAIIEGRGSKHQGYLLSEALDVAWARRWKTQKGQRQLSYVVNSVRTDLGTLECRAISYSVLEEWVDQLEDKGLAPATINSRLTVVSVALDLAAKRNKITGVPPMPYRKKNNRKFRFVTHEEEALLFSEAKKYPPMDLLITVLVDTGCRLSEITHSGPESIMGEQLVLLDTKNGKSRSVPLTRRAKVSLRALHGFPEWREVTHGVHTSDVRKGSAKDWCVKRFTKIRNAAGLPDVSLHTLRHTCASRLVQGGVDLYKVKEWLGHSSITMTERYAHLAPDSLREVANVLERPEADVITLRRN